MQTTLTSKGQLTLPKAIREQLKVSAGDRLDFFISSEGHLEGVVVRDSAKKLKGMLPKPDKAVSLENMEAAIAEGVSKA